MPQHASGREAVRAANVHSYRMLLRMNALGPGDAQDDLVLKKYVRRIRHYRRDCGD